MKRFSFLLGVGVGFFLGSRAGSQPYDRLASTVRRTANRPETQSAVDQVKGAARHQAESAVQKIGDKLPSSDTSTASKGDAQRPEAEVEALKGDASHPTIDPENVAGAGEEAADRGITGLEV